MRAQKLKTNKSRNDINNQNLQKLIQSAIIGAVAASTQASAADMKAQGQACFTQWEKPLARIKDPQIRQLATSQKTKLEATFDDIRKVTQPLKEQFDPWLSDMKDLRTYLSNDLTVSGVDTAKSLFTKVQTEGWTCRNPWTPWSPSCTPWPPR